MDPIQILLIDQHAAFTASILTFLKLYNEFQVVATASDGDHGLHAAQSLSLDVILVSLELHGSTGLKTIRELRTALPSVGIIALALNDQDSYQQAAASFGADGFVSKLRVVEELAPAIQRVMLSRSPQSQRLSPRSQSGRPQSGQLQSDQPQSGQPQSGWPQSGWFQSGQPHAE